LLLPTDGSVKDGIYTNSFFKFSIEFPRAWKILDTGTSLTGNNMGLAAGLIPPAGNYVEALYSLFWAGTVEANHAGVSDAETRHRPAQIVSDISEPPRNVGLLANLLVLLPSRPLLQDAAGSSLSSAQSLHAFFGIILALLLSSNAGP
jgi:hypothetical protein